MKKNILLYTRITFAAIIIPCAVATFLSCEKKPGTNRVDMDQINYDNSTNYETIFKDQVEKQKERDNRYKKDEF
jgi:hypothetical protein